MDRDGLTVVPEASAPIVTALAGEPVGEPTAEPAAAQPGEQAAGQPTRQRRRGTFRALSSRPFRLYFIGQVASASGTFLHQTAMGWLVLKLTGNAASLGLVLAAGGVPSLLFGPWGGTICAITSAGGTRAALLTGAAACLVAAGVAALVHTPPHPDAALTDLVPQREPR
jgi:hypothetical protein